MDIEYIWGFILLKESSDGELLITGMVSNK
jgi:hypothetical protein